MTKFLMIVHHDGAIDISEVEINNGTEDGTGNNQETGGRNRSNERMAEFKKINKQL